MAHLIDKDKIVAEIKRLSEYVDSYHEQRTMGKILLFLETLEVKEVDLDKEIDRYYNIEAPKEFEDVLYEDIEKFAKHFFELGLSVGNSVDNKAQKGE